LIGAAVEACERALTTLAKTNTPPSSAGAVSVGERFRKFGADEWSELRTRFSAPQATKKAG
jgi:hypothetical protein